MLTLEERERLAYIKGDVELAKVLAELIDTPIVTQQALDDAYEEGYRDGGVDE